MVSAANRSASNAMMMFKVDHHRIVRGRRTPRSPPTQSHDRHGRTCGFSNGLTRMQMRKYCEERPAGPKRDQSEVLAN